MKKTSRLRYLSKLASVVRLAAWLALRFVAYVLASLALKGLHSFKAAVAAYRRWRHGRE